MPPAWQGAAAPPANRNEGPPSPQFFPTALPDLDEKLQSLITVRSFPAGSVVGRRISVEVCVIDVDTGLKLAGGAARSMRSEERPPVPSLKGS